MNTQYGITWRKRADRMDALLNLKHISFEKVTSLNLFTNVKGIGLKRKLIGSLRRWASKPRVNNNFFIRFLFRVKNRLGIKFR